MIGQPLDRQATLILVLVGAFAGLFGGSLMTLFLYPTTWSIADMLLYSGMGFIFGVIGAWLIMLELRLRGQAIWGVWLQGLIPARSFISTSCENHRSSISFIVIANLISGLGAGLVGALFGQANGGVYPLLFILILIVIISFVFEKQAAVINSGIGLTSHLTIGLFFGIGFAQVVGQLIGLSNVLDSGRAVGLAVGTVAALHLGHGTGLILRLLIQALFTVLVLVVGPNVVLIGWLLGMLAGGIMDSLYLMWTDQTLTFANVYPYRPLLLWWSKRPPATLVETALQQHPAKGSWKKLIDELKEQRKHLRPVQALWAYLRRPYWIDRFIGRHTIVTLGEEAIPYLLNVIKRETHPLQNTAVWLIKSISYETSTRLSSQSEWMLCPNCLTCCGPHKISHPDLSTIYYGCRTCQQSREFFECNQGVIAVLDSMWSEAYHYQNRLMRVNWLQRCRLFDFDWVEIIHATDEEVERFAVQISNDTDPVRQPRYPQMICKVKFSCHLSENTIRILEHTFGQVTQQ